MTALSVSQVAERWGCSVNTVYRLINHKRLKAFSAGRNTTRVLRSVVEAYERGEPWGSGDGIRSGNTGLDSSTGGLSSSGETKVESIASGSQSSTERTPTPRRKGARRSIDTLAAGRY